MNFENIVALDEQLASLGFESTGYLLMKRICFKPLQFTINEKIQICQDSVCFRLFYEANAQQTRYSLVYFDALLIKAMESMRMMVNGICIPQLEKSMSSINWDMAFDANPKNSIPFTNYNRWEKEVHIESVIEQLIQLGKTSEGQSIANWLQSKYWTGLLYQEWVGNLCRSPEAATIYQRFYLFEGQSGISVNEAYRFLQNQWLEKKQVKTRNITIAGIL